MATSYKQQKLRKIEIAKVNIAITYCAVFPFTEIVPDMVLFKNTFCIFHRVIFTIGPSVKAKKTGVLKADGEFEN